MDKKIHRLLIGAIPFAVFAFALAIICIGFFQYVENESILAVFLTKRDAMIPSGEWHGQNWVINANSGEAPILDNSKRAIIRKNARLLVPFFYIGEQFGTLDFSRIGLTVPVFQGDSEAQFRLGAGHLTTSYFPGQDNNIVIGGHRTTDFRKLEYVKVGDVIDFGVVYGDFSYRIDEIRIIKSGDSSIAAPAKKEQLTLYTCYPFVYIGNAPKRYVLICSLLESEIFK
ncbi:MAG: class D sortase [Saccharofermentanales bacterium]